MGRGVDKSDETEPRRREVLDRASQKEGSPAPAKWGQDPAWHVVTRSDVWLIHVVGPGESLWLLLEARTLESNRLRFQTEPAPS